MLEGHIRSINISREANLFRRYWWLARAFIMVSFVGFIQILGVYILSGLAMRPQGQGLGLPLAWLFMILFGSFIFIGAYNRFLRTAFFIVALSGSLPLGIYAVALIKAGNEIDIDIMSVLAASTTIGLFWVFLAAPLLTSFDIDKGLNQTGSGIFDSKNSIIGKWLALTIGCGAIVIAAFRPGTTLQYIHSNNEPLWLKILLPTQGAIEWMLSSTCLALTGLGLPVCSDVDFNSINFYLIPGDAALLAILLLPVIHLARHIKRRIQKSAHETLRGDARKPILLLRSFQDDTAALRPKGVWSMVQGRRLRLEEVISQFIGGVGPFVAIGKPGEPLPQLGAARAYLPDDGWQEVVLRWMNESRAILMVAGLTKWVDWELQQVVLHGYTSKLIVLFPPDSVENQILRTSKFAAGLGVAMRPEETRGLLAICFQPDGLPVLVHSTGGSQIAYELAILASLAAMQPLNR